MKRFGCLFVVFALFLFSCQKDAGNSTLNINISDEIQLELWEALSVNQRFLHLRLSTIDDLECENYTISYSVNTADQRISVSINDLIAPTVCIPGMAPGTGLISLGAVDPNLYTIEINLKNNQIINKGILNVFSDKIKLDMQTDYGIQFPYTTLLRMPENTIWGYIDFMDNSADEEAIGQDIYETLGPLTNTLVLPSGEYGHFKIIDQNIESIKIDHADRNENVFLLEQTATKTEFESALEEIRNRYDSALSVHLFFSDGSSL